ncbi:hypothetical protein N7454_003597 [Penicillium verhagenii]|nr:hypothetical protein N7454_003597 [Penicillium verhagenii]
MGDLASGLMALHRCGIVHGDLKADNVVVFSSLDRPSLSLAKLSDFGHSILVGSTPKKRSRYLGTTLYNAPEVAFQEDRPIPIEQLHKCDIWAFGLCVWEILADGNSYFQSEWRNDISFEKPPSYNLASISTSSKPHEVSVGEDNQNAFAATLAGFRNFGGKKEPMKDNGSAAFQTMLCYVNAFGTSTNLEKATQFLHKTQESGHLVARILGSRLLSAFAEPPSTLSGEYGECLASGFRLISSPKSPIICLHIGETSTEFADYIALRTAFIDEEAFVGFDQDDIATANLERNNSSERQNILEVAIQEGDIDLVDLLLQNHGLKLNEMKTKECLLVQAARNGHGPIVNRLLQEDISIFRDDSCSCLLHWLFCFKDPSLHQLQQQLQSPSRKDDLKRALDHAITQKVPVHPQWPFQVHGTPLATAIASGNISAVKLLLELKADPTATAFLSTEGDEDPLLTPIHLAISYHLPEVFKILWYAAFGERAIIASQLSRTHVLSQFPIACALSFRSNAERFAMHMNNHRLRIRDIIQLLPIEALIQSSPEGKNALTQAIDLEDFDTVKLILECHPELAARKITQPGANNMFTYPLHFAVQIGSLRETDESIQILESIIKLDPTAVNKPDSSSAKPIHAAAMGTSTRILNLLLENGCTCHDLDGRGRTPLFFCRKATMTNGLLQIGAEINHRDQQGFTPAHAAPIQGTEEVLGALIESGADLSLTNNGIGTPLHCAVREKSLSMVEMLLKAGVDVNRKNTYGRTALLVATSMDTRRSDLVSLLFENGADPFIEDNNGLSPFHMALAWPNTSILSKFQTLNTFNTLQWEKKIVALHFAAEHAEPAALTLFLHKAFGSGLSADNPVFLYHKDFSIALHKAILACRADLVEAMLSYGFQANSLDSNGNTPLLIACQIGRDGSPSTNPYARTPICEMLLAHGAKICKTEGRDMTPFFIAHAHKDYPLMTLLLEHALGLGNFDSARLRARMLESIKDPEKSTQYSNESRALIGDEIIDPQVVLQAATEGEWEFIMTCIGGQFISKEQLRQVFHRRRWSFGVDSLDMLRFHSARRDREMVRYLHEMALTGRLTLQRTSEIGQRNLQVEFGGWRGSLNETLWPKKIDKLFGGEKEGSPKQRERSKRFMLMLRNHGARESEDGDKERKCGWSSDELSDDSVSSDDESGSEEPGDGSGMQESGDGVDQDDDEPVGYDVKLPV